MAAQTARWAQVLAGALAVGAAAALGGSPGGRGPAHGRAEGQVTAGGGSAVALAPGAAWDLGPAVGVKVDGDFPAGTALVWGEGAAAITARADARPGLYDATGAPRHDTPPSQGAAGDARTLALDCAGALRFSVNGAPAGSLHGRACTAQPVRLVAPAGATVRSLVRDGAPIALGARGLDPRRSALGAAAGLAAVLGLGPGVALWIAAGALLFATPLPGAAALPLGLALAGAGALGGAGPRWRRALGALTLLAGLGGAARAVWLAAAPAGASGAAPTLPTAALERALVEQKVDLIVTRGRASLAALPDDGRPLVVTLGSSSSGGGTPGAFWPRRLAAARPDLRVLDLAEGGATSWHMARALEGLGLRPAACLLYLGHNDTTAALPGFTLLQLEADAARPAGDGPAAWTAPVPAADQPAVWARITARCGRSLFAVEHVPRRAADMAAIEDAMRAQPGVEVVAVGPALAALGAAGMVDDVHPSMDGQAVLAATFDAALGPVGPAGAPRP